MRSRRRALAWSAIKGYQWGQRRGKPGGWWITEGRSVWCGAAGGAQDRAFAAGEGRRGLSRARDFPLREVRLLLTTQVRRLSGGRILSLVMLGGLALGTGVASANPAPQAHAAPRYSWVNLDGQWLCRSWSDSAPVASVIVPGAQDSAGATDAPHTVWDLDPTGGRAYGMTGQTTTRCTTHWRIDDALRLVSDDVAWTPNPTGAWPLANDLLTFDRAAHQARPHVRTLTRVVKRHATPATRTTSAPRTPTGGAPGGSTGGSTGGGGSYNPWAPVPGHPTYSMGDFAGDPYASSFGVCTWYAWYRHRSEPLASFGPARNWLAGARAYGLAVGSQPAVGATVVFAPGVEGAGGTGHVGHVEAVLGGGWFMISEMNFYWNGGGWGRVDYRYVYVTSGVSFIY